MRRLTIAALVLLVLAACRQKATAPSGAAAGGPKAAKTRVLETGAGVLQAKGPIEKIDMYLDGFHFASGDMSHQVEAHHYCSKLSDDFIQCAIYSGNGADARLIGIEYVVSEALFRTLPADEKRLWHSHRYEVKSGQLIAPGIPANVEFELMQQLVTTYGKTWHTWRDESQKVPLGGPALMMGFTADGQLSPFLSGARDRRFNVSTAGNRGRHVDIPEPAVEAGADSWQHGDAPKVWVTPPPIIDTTTTAQQP